MAYLLDYSAGQISGPIVKSAGYAGTIRYIDSTLGGKHTTQAEYASLIASGLTVRLVMEVNTKDANGGYNQGLLYARRALAGADKLGYRGVIYFCNDSPALDSATLWDDYLTGAAAVLGWGRVGAYGFANAMDVAAHMTPCQHFWQAGRRSDVRPFVQVWQDNNTQVTVGGIRCDRNLILKPLEGDDMTPEQANQLQYVYDALLKGGASTPYGWSLQDLLKATHGNGLAVLTESVPALATELAAIKANQTAPVPVEVDYDRIINGVVAKLSTLKFDVE